MKRSPLRQDHARSARAMAQALELVSQRHDRLLHGARDFGWPVLALRTNFALGPVRHALSQQVVAGTMTVFPPVAAHVSPAAPNADETP